MLGKSAKVVMVATVAATEGLPPFNPLDNISGVFSGGFTLPPTTAWAGVVATEFIVE
jgi:hypothetical protein